MDSIDSIEGLELSAQSILDTIEAIKKVESLSNTEKSENIKKANEILRNIIKEKQCRKCHNVCDNLNSCEFCIQSFLESRFKKWTSGDAEIDEYIKNCQKNIRWPDNVIEWIPYSNLQDIKYTIEGGMYHVMKALWTEGRYTNWDFSKQELKRFGPHYVTIKNVSMNNPTLPRQEIKSHFLLTSTMSPVVRTYGLTKDGNNDYMIITENVSHNLKNYLKENISTLTWVDKYRILQNILESLGSIHNKKLIHGDLHSGIVRLSVSREIWLIGDLRFCTPIDNPSEIRSGTISYVAPEMLKKEKAEKMTISSDIYSFGMIMWEVSTGRQPFDDRPAKLLQDEITSGSRPEIMEKTPKHYATLMTKCWDQYPSNRPSLVEIQNEINKILDDHFKGLTSPQEQKEMKETCYFKAEYVVTTKKHDEYASRPNKGKEIEIIPYDQIKDEKFNDGVGRISFATMSERRVAIKTLQINKFDKTNERMDSILSELLQQKISRWDHIYQDKNIVEFLGVGSKDEKRIFLVMPFANNDNLRKYMKNNKLAFGEKLEIAKGVASGIKVLHNNKIVHGNINPNNILIFDKIPKISNLPLPFENKDFKRKDLYIGSDLFDNIGYIDPNLFLNKQGNRKDNYPVDIYSLGTLLWEIMSEKVPYQSDGVLKLIQTIKAGYREDADIPYVPSEYKDLYTECWQEDSKSRPEINHVYGKLLNIK